MSNVEKATFAGGCFWCMVEPFDERPGIHAVISGYTGGTVEYPTYAQVCSNTTGHVEAVQITYDPQIVSYRDLVDIFWQQINPTDPGGQFHDRGSSYQTAIFYHNEAQRTIAQQSKKDLAESGRFTDPIVTPILAAKPFYTAEEQHQYYYKRNRAHYEAYKRGSGRQQFIEQHWESENGTNEVEMLSLKQRLTPMQYYVTKQNGTEPPFQNEYWNLFEEGIYVDIISGEVLFSSKDKYDAHCGWPSFVKTINEAEITEHLDTTHGMIRTEVRSKTGNAHLGHLFNDGPSEKGGMRYCINSAALKFIKKADMEKAGYGDYLYLLD